MTKKLDWFRRFADAGLPIVLRILARIDVRGLENTPPFGPLIIVINHTSFFDPLLVLGFLPRKITPLAKEELTKMPIISWLVSSFGVIPIKRGAIDRNAITESLKVLRAGDGLIVAPEGTRSPTGELQRGRSGVTLLAARTGATILPFAIWGVKPFWKNLFRLKRTTAHVAIGKPFRITVEGHKVPREQIDEITDEIMYQLARLLPAEYRGVYKDLDQATERHLHFDDKT
jgi:1-acyl-sn-glycerol-3-phosphate acyltransferase